jgi:ribosomal protein L11 methyltransferase
MIKSKSDEPVLTDVTSLRHRSARTWLKIVIRVDSRMSEAVAAYLTNLSGGGIEISSGNDHRSEKTSGAEKLTGYITLDLEESDQQSGSIKNDINRFISSLSDIFPDCSPPDISSEIIREEDWSRVWKSFFSTFKITPNLVIKPSWEEIEEKQDADENSNVIEMDPGLAFGTGHHASTRLALLLLEELFRDQEHRLSTVLDVGTGSGILAMGCALFGAARVLAIDNDPDAVETAKGNISRNRLDHTITASGQDVTSVKPEYSLIVANITHDTLAGMSECLTRLLEPQGYLVLSGILKGEQEHSICDIYTGKGLHLTKAQTMDEWAALLFQKD